MPWPRLTAKSLLYWILDKCQAQTQHLIDIRGVPDHPNIRLSVNRLPSMLFPWSHSLLVPRRPSPLPIHPPTCIFCSFSTPLFPGFSFQPLNMSPHNWFVNQPKSNNNNQIQPTNPLISQKTQFTLPLGLLTPWKPGRLAGSLHHIIGQPYQW